MKLIKIILINCIVFFSLLGFIILLPPSLFLLMNIYNKSNTEHSDDYKYSEGRADLINYNDFEWAKKNLEEIETIHSLYHDYIIWRKNNFNGETITVEKGVRKTTNPSNTKKDTEFWFFGGSTMWGTGVNDSNTIPSLFSKKTYLKSFNYGEGAYQARQSLAYLTNLYIKNKNNKNKTKNIIVFYDGVNDIKYCANKSNLISTNREIQIRDTLRGRDKIGYDKWSYERSFAQTKDLIISIRNRLFSSKQIEKQNKTYFYKCSTSEKHAKDVARTLVNIWVQANNIAKSNGDDFVAILQPVASIGKPYLNHIEFNPIWIDRINQYKFVYPLIKKYALEENINFLDMTDIYDVNYPVYIDFCHVSPQGNELVVERLLLELNLLGLL